MKLALFTARTITSTVFLACIVLVQRWNAVEEKRLKQEGELQTFITQLLMEHKDRYSFLPLPTAASMPLLPLAHFFNICF